jgi:hypothetical protein
MKRKMLLLAMVSWCSIQVSPQVMAQTTTPIQPSPVPAPPGGNLNPQDQRLLQQFKQQHPNFSQNHPKLSQFYKSHPKALDQGIDKYGMRQFGQKHQGWVDNHPKQAKFDYNHPQWTENHPGRALGFGGGRRGGHR